MNRKMPIPLGTPCSHCFWTETFKITLLYSWAGLLLPFHWNLFYVCDFPLLILLTKVSKIMSTLQSAGFLRSTFRFISLHVHSARTYHHLSPLVCLPTFQFCLFFLQSTPVSLSHSWPQLIFLVPPLLLTHVALTSLLFFFYVSSFPRLPSPRMTFFYSSSWFTTSYLPSFTSDQRLVHFPSLHSCINHSYVVLLLAVHLGFSSFVFCITPHHVRCVPSFMSFSDHVPHCLLPYSTWVRLCQPPARCSSSSGIFSSLHTYLPLLLPPRPCDSQTSTSTM